MAVARDSKVLKQGGERANAVAHQRLPRRTLELILLGVSQLVIVPTVRPL